MANQQTLAASIEDTIENVLLEVAKWRTDNPTTIDYRIEKLHKHLTLASGCVAQLLTTGAHS